MAINQKHGLGAILSPKDVRDYSAKCTAVTSTKKFPTSFKLELSPVKNQGFVGSCVAHALSTAIEYFNTNQNNDATEMSVGYIYGNRNTSLNKASGMIVREALAAVRIYGDVPSSKFPENEEPPEIIDLFESRFYSLQDEGYSHRISTYCRLLTKDSVKQALMKNGPVIMAMKWYDDMEVKNGLLTTNRKDYCGNHCMVIYGWDERGWKVQNSWGTYWGNGGRCVIPYDMPIRELWAVTDDIIEGMNIVKPYSSDFGKKIASFLNSFWQIMYKLLEQFNREK